MRTLFHCFFVSVILRRSSSLCVQDLERHSSRISLAVSSWKSTIEQLAPNAGQKRLCSPQGDEHAQWDHLETPHTHITVRVETKQMTAVGAGDCQRDASEMHYPSPNRDKWWASSPCKYLPQWITPQRRASAHHPILISRMPNQTAHGTNLPLSSCSECARVHVEALETS